MFKHCYQPLLPCKNVKVNADSIVFIVSTKKKKKKELSENRWCNFDFLVIS